MLRRCRVSFYYRSKRVLISAEQHILETLACTDAGVEMEFRTRYKEDLTNILICIKRMQQTIWRLIDVPYSRSNGRKSEPRAYLYASDYLTSNGKFTPENYLKFLDSKKKETGLSVAEAIRSLQFVELHAIYKYSNLLKSANFDEIAGVFSILKAVRNLDQDLFIKSLIEYEEILESDPARVYHLMDLPTKNSYRLAVEEIGVRTGRTSVATCNAALAMARDRHRAGKEKPFNHIGYYLASEGISEILQNDPQRPGTSTEFGRCGVKYAVYLLPIIFSTLALILLLKNLLSFSSAVLSFFSFLCAWILLFDASLLIFHDFIRYFTPRRALPGLNFLHGIPEAESVVIAIPTLLINKRQLDKVLGVAEQNFRTSGEKIVLLLDFVDSQMEAPSDKELELLSYVVSKAKDLNARYSQSKDAVWFVVAWRPRRYSPAEKCWMGWERKRGKVAALFEYILREPSELIVPASNRIWLEKIRYVVVVDDDNILMPMSIRYLVGNAAHPLNKPRVERGEVKGYGIVVPFLDQKSRFRTRSEIVPRNVVFDWFGCCEFTGKGIYDVAFCHQRLKHLVPEGKILSHDAFEGFWVRPGYSALASVMEDYPSNYVNLSERGHRWVRGDWQNFYAMLSGLKSERPKFFSWLAIFRQLRVSIVPVSALLLLVIAILDANQRALLIGTLGLIIYPWVKLSEQIIFLYPDFRKDKMLFIFDEVRRNSILSIVKIANIPHQAAINCDAIVRASFRYFVGRRLLEWRSAGLIEHRADKTTLSSSYLLICLIFSITLFVYIRMIDNVAYLTALVVISWILSPVLMLAVRRRQS